MKRFGVGLCLCLCLTGLCGCQKVKDMVYTPEETVVDYAKHLAHIMNTQADCDKLAAELASYCSEREAFVTQAVEATVKKFNNNEISEAQLKELRKDLEPLKNTNFTSCLLTPNVAISKVNCLKPLTGVVNAL